MRKKIAITASIAFLIFAITTEPHAVSANTPTAYTCEEIELLAKTVWGEARGCSPDEQRLVIWTVLQRVNADGYGNTIKTVLKAPRQFKGYRAENPIDAEIITLCEIEAEKWARGERPPTLEPYAPTLPYFYFDGGNGHNWFRGTYNRR